MRAERNQNYRRITFVPRFPLLRAVGTKAKIDFLVQEGQIRAEAIVRHIEPGKGLAQFFGKGMALGQAGIFICDRL
jgi:hypothetical protein